ncbi:GntR family transcriptional regulator [Paracoccus sp. (in: a-proteobacteria)]|uniref:GntR family transcriptional regulator n=1 Tax=Paracoccus sp. TaxID=267 RepID=UPI003A855A88
MSAANERDRVMALLEEDIVFGRLKPRERLVEIDIMERFGVRRHIARSALEALEGKGLVQRKANRGAQVRDPGMREITELYMMRDMLHRAACEQTPLPLSDHDAAALSGIQARHDAAVAAGDLGEAFHQNEHFHACLNSLCNNKVLEEALNFYNERTNIIRSVAFRSTETLQHSARQHHAIIDAAMAGDRARFGDCVLDHILGARHAYLNDTI